MFNLSGKGLLVTGASGGIGASIASALHECGASVVLSGTREEALLKLAEELGDQAYPISCDLSDKVSIESLVERSDLVLGGIDGLIHCAGVTSDNLAMRMKDDEWENVIDINLKSAFRLARASLRGMMKKRWGRIIFITSVVGAIGNPGQANYAASKAGLTGMAKAMAGEVASRGITVNCVAPGFIDTPMTQALSDKQRENMGHLIPIGRFGTSGDIAAGCVYLASEEAGYITGQTIHINGGMAMV